MIGIGFLVIGLLLLQLLLLGEVHRANVHLATLVDKVERAASDERIRHFDCRHQIKDVSQGLHHGGY